MTSAFVLNEASTFQTKGYNNDQSLQDQEDTQHKPAETRG